MSIGFSRFDTLPALLAGTATVVAIAIAPTVVVAKTGTEIGQIASAVTVQINDNAFGGGSGVIVAKSGNTYTILTANHVVKRPDLTYTISTYTGKKYPVIRVERLQSSENGPDLAVITFNTPDEYPVATLGNSDQAAIGADIYISGYPALSGQTGAERNYEFTKGIVSGRRQIAPQGYTLRYNAETEPGMSGGPVFDASGRVVGIHGQGDSRFEATGAGTIPIKTGFNSAIPINTFMALKSQTGLSSSITVNNTPTVTVPARPNNPTNARDYYARGVSQLDSGNRQEAITDFNKALQLNPNQPSAYYNRGNARNDLGDKQGAIQDYTATIQLNSSDAAAYYNRGNTRTHLGDKRGAIQDYTQALRLNPNDAAAYYNRAEADYDLGDKQGAIKDYSQAIRLYPKFALAYNNLGRAYYDLGDKQAAVQNYTQAIRLSPKLALAYNNLGRAHYDLGDKQAALRDYTQAIRLYPSYATAYYNRAMVRNDLGDKQGAIQDYTQAIRCNHNYTLAYYNRAVVRNHLGDKQGAMTDLQHVANIYQLEGNKVEYQNVLARIKELGY